MSGDAGRRTLLCAASLGALAVALGAFGAHALDSRLSSRALGWYQTAASYHAGHALTLFGCGLLARLSHGYPTSQRLLRVSALCLVAGIALFAGSLYLMAFTGWTRLGIVTPFGGLALIAGWVSLAAAAWHLRAPGER